VLKQSIFFTQLVSSYGFVTYSKSHEVQMFSKLT